MSNDWALHCSRNVPNRLVQFRSGSQIQPKIRLNPSFTPRGSEDETSFRFDIRGRATLYWQMWQLLQRWGRPAIATIKVIQTSSFVRRLLLVYARCVHTPNQGHKHREQRWLRIQVALLICLWSSAKMCSYRPIGLLRTATEHVKLRPTALHRVSQKQKRTMFTVDRHCKK